MTGVTQVPRVATQGLVKSYPMAAPAFSIPSQNAIRLADPALREALLKYARRRLPPGEVEDLVQNTLTDALVAATAPSDENEFRRFVHGIARHKIADRHRRRGRQPIPSLDLDQTAAETSPSTGELTQWIESELPKTDGAQATLHWLLRESDGESLDEIARDLDLPAPRVRQRVSRLRRHFHARWLALGAAGLLGLVAAGALLERAAQRSSVAPIITREASTPIEQARVLREDAMLRCAAREYSECIARLDRAKVLDPRGESSRAVVEARDAAARFAQHGVTKNLAAGSASVPPREEKPVPKRDNRDELRIPKLAPEKSKPVPAPAENYAGPKKAPGKKY